jgi:hypothetical protein
LQHSTFDAHAELSALQPWHLPARHDPLQHSAFDAHTAFSGLHV